LTIRSVNYNHPGQQTSGARAVIVALRADAVIDHAGQIERAGECASGIRESFIRNTGDRWLQTVSIGECLSADASPRNEASTAISVN
jgi:hypothetical protein